MDPQLLNFFTNLTEDLDAFLTAYSRIEDRFQEAFDREIDDQLVGLDFEGTGDLNHLNPDNLGDAFAAFSAVKVVMDANDRARWTAMLEVLRTWTR